MAAVATPEHAPRLSGFIHLQVNAGPFVAENLAARHPLRCWGRLYVPSGSGRYRGCGGGARNTQRAGAACNNRGAIHLVANLIVKVRISRIPWSHDFAVCWIEYV